MLQELSIRNIAIIDELSVSFRPGFTVLTGETGAGKSIIVDAVSLLIGARGSVELIRSGTEEASVEAVFDVTDLLPIRELLAEGGIADGSELLMKRVISRSGRNRCYLNGSLSTLAMLTRIGRALINIYGQHESQTLLESNRHLGLLDSFGAIDTSRYRSIHERWAGVCSELSSLEIDERDAVRRQDLLTYQRDELRAASVVSGEYERLCRERELLRNAAKLARAGEEGYELLSGADDAVSVRLAGVVRLVAEATRIDGTLQPTLATLESAATLLDEAARELAGYSSRLDLDPGRIDEVEGRLHLIERLSRKYGKTADELPDLLGCIERELSLVEHRDERADSLRRERDLLESELLEEAERLSCLRREAAGLLSAGIRREFAELAMPNAELEVAVRKRLSPGPDGCDDIEFLFAPNPGEGTKPLAKIASGGELSRIMLALKQLLSEKDVPTLVFDEVDSGIGGATAAMVGRKLSQVARGQQVLCITHLPAVASAATHHLSVIKTTSRGRTTTVVRELSLDERVEEIARMLGGMEVTDTTRAHARELLRSGMIPEEGGRR